MKEKETTINRIPEEILSSLALGLKIEGEIARPVARQLKEIFKFYFASKIPEIRRVISKFPKSGTIFRRVISVGS